MSPDPWDFATSAAQPKKPCAPAPKYLPGDLRAKAPGAAAPTSWRRIDKPTALRNVGLRSPRRKLARAEKPTYVLQLCFYTEAIAAIQRATPEAYARPARIGDATLRHADLRRYYRRVRRGSSRRSTRAARPSPNRVEHCALCEFRQVCDERWQQEVTVAGAGIDAGRSTHLRSAGLHTLKQLAQAPATPVPHVAAHSFEARTTSRAPAPPRTTGALDWHALPIEPGCRLLSSLPWPAGDVIFDIEGDPFWEPARGLHFLLGC